MICQSLVIRHGTLQVSYNCWFFYPGKHKADNGIALYDFEANCRVLLDTGQCFKGHAKFKNVYDVRSQVSLQQCVLHHASAHGLHSLVVPSSLKHHFHMTPTDKQIWDAAYDEEYDGWTSLPLWQVIT
jgi:hypothetical protein